MKYLLDRPFRDRRGASLKGINFLKAGTEDPVSGDDIMLGDVLYTLAENYVPTDKSRLTNAQMRKLWDAQDVVAAGPTAKGYFVFENDHFEILKDEALAMLDNFPLIAKHGPVLEDALESAVTRTIEEGPPDNPASHNGSSEEDVPEPVEFKSVAGKKE